MRGVPNHKVCCSRCGKLAGCPKDGLCHGCRIRSRPNPQKRFSWTPELDQALIRAYKQARTRLELSENLDHFQRRTGFTRVVALSRAVALGLGSRRKTWTPEERQLVAEWAGTFSKAAIARKLRRSYWSVKAELSKLELSARVTEGYSQNDMVYLLGVSARMLRKWISLGWLSVHGNRITEASVVRFLREHPGEYSLNRVDEAWFKGLLFPAFGKKRIERESASPVTTFRVHANPGLAI